MTPKDDKIGLSPREGAENWENPDIDALLDMRAFRLLSKQEVIDKLTALRDYFERRLRVLHGSRTNISDFINQMTEGGGIEQRLDEVVLNLEGLQAKMYEEESDDAEARYKDKFNELLEEILVKKAEIQRATLERFIEQSPPYLDRVMRQAREEGEKDVMALVEEARKLKGGKDKDEVKDTLTWLSGEENDMSPVDFKIWSEELEAKAKTALESWLKGDTDDQNFDARFSELLDEARFRGGEKAVLRLRTLRNEYRVRRENYELSELAYIHNIFGEKGEGIGNTSGKLFLELRNIREKVRYREYTDQEAASELWRRLASMIESDSANLSFHLENGELKNAQDFIGILRAKYEGGELDFDGMIAECFSYRDGLPAREKRHKEDRDRYAELAADAKEEYSKVAHDALVYGFLYKDLTEKDDARKVLEEMDSDMATALELLKEDFESGESTRIRAASYTLDRVDDFLTVVAAVELSGATSAGPAKTKPETASIDHLLGAFNAFEGHETPVEDALKEIENSDPELGAKIRERISQVGDEVRFVDRQSFDKFFDGKNQDNFRGLPGAFHMGTIFLVYPLDTLDAPSIERLYKVLTHEAIHHTMHSIASTETGQSLNTLLYKSPTYSEGGLQLALSGNTIGAQIIRQFMTDRGDEFEDWVQRRTKVGRNRKSNGKLTFEEVIRNEDVAKEILEEAITVYLTYYALNGKQAGMRPPYLDYLRRLHETDEGKEMFARFMPDSVREEAVSLGADDAGESGIPSSLGEGSGSKEKKVELPPPDLKDLMLSADAVLVGTIVLIKKRLKELYNVEDYEGILAESTDQLNSLKSEIDRLMAQEAESGEKASPATRRSIQQSIKNIDDNLKENMLTKLDDEKRTRDDVPEDELGYVRRLWKETTFVSLDDVLKIFQDGWAYLKERRELRRDRVAAQIGESIAPTERMSSYFEGLKQSVQNRDISKWKEIYTDKDPDSLEKILDKASDINQVKALFEIKAEHHGDFFFRSKQTKKAIERVSGKKVDTYYQAKDIYDDLYGTGEADGLERKNASTRKGKVSESADMAKSHADNLELEWMKMIAAVEEHEWVDSAKFEGFIHYALTAGKSYLRAVLWMIVKGYTLGILDYKTIVEMGGSALVKNAPHIEHLGDIIKDHEAGVPYEYGTNGQTEIEYVASLDLFDNEGNETRSPQSTQTTTQLDHWIAYETWLLGRVEKTDRVQQRYGKIKSSSDNLDHDYVQDMWWEFNRGAYESILNERTGSVQFIQDQGIANVYGQFITNSLYWTDEDMMEKYNKWFKTDRLFVEEGFVNKGGEFTIEAGLKQKGNNKTILDDDKLEGVTGALYKGIPMKHFRNLAYFAWKESSLRGGGMQMARDIMMAGALDMNFPWVPEASVRRYYQVNAGNGWNYANVEYWQEQNDPRALPDAPQSHLYEFRGTSMAEDLVGGYPPGFIEGL